MKDKKCAICLRRIDNEDAPILAMGAYGIPKCLCDECAELIETATLSREYESIVGAMDTVTKIMSDGNIDDKITIETVNGLFAEAAKRASAIKEGRYDFSLDEGDGDDSGFDEIPEELRETEEDKELDEKDKKANARFDRIMNWLSIPIILLIGFVVWWFFIR